MWQHTEEYEELNTARLFALEQHEKIGQLYGNSPYQFHLKDVYQEAENNFLYLPKTEDYYAIYKACWGHDLLEDCCNYNDILPIFGLEASEIIYAVTNELGRNRRERAEKTYPKIRENEGAIFVKLCDRLANTKYSLWSKGSMFAKYQAEFPLFKESLLIPETPMMPMWEELEAYTFQEMK